MTNESPSADRRKAECPSCGKPLKKVPAAKTKCPHCGEPMFVRTQAEDRARVVVTRTEAERIDAEWQKRAEGQQFARFLTEQEIQSEKDRHRRAWRDKGYREPSDEDMIWGLLNRKSIEHAANGDWGLYRNMRLGMAEFLNRSGSSRQALVFYLEVCTLDLNGATNSNRYKTPEILRTFPAFDPRHAFTAPAVLSEIRWAAEKVAMNLEQLKAFYLENDVSRNLHLPLSPDRCWSLLEAALSGADSTDRTKQVAL